MLALALATHSSLLSFLLLLPVVLVLLGTPVSHLASPHFHPLFTNFRSLRSSAGLHIGAYMLYMIALTVLAATTTGDFTFRWMEQTWNVGYVYTSCKGVGPIE